MMQAFESPMPSRLERERIKAKAISRRIKHASNKSRERPLGNHGALDIRLPVRGGEVGLEPSFRAIPEEIVIEDRER